MNGLLTHFTKPTAVRPTHRSPSLTVRVAFIIGTLLLAACDEATPVPSPTPQPINTVAPAVEPTAAAGEAVTTETIEVAATPTDTEAATEVLATQAPPTAVPNDTGVSLTVPPSLAQSYESQLEAAVPLGEGPAFGGAAPEHVLIAFDQEKIEFPGNPRERQIRVYPVSGLRAIDPFFGEEIDKLQAMLAKKPATYNDNITALPLVNAAQVFHTQLKYLDFANGAGVRFLSAYAQDITPITNENIFYTFQGLTSDGLYYISAFYPISSTALPNTYAESTAAQNMDEFAKDYTSKYLPGVAEGLNSLPADQFVPDLSELDTLVQSLSAMPVSLSTTVLTATVMTGTGVETPTEIAPSVEITEPAVTETVMTATTGLTKTAEPAATLTPTTVLTAAVVETATVAVTNTASAPVTTTVALTEVLTPVETEVPTATVAPAEGVTPTAESAATAALQPAGEGTILRLVNLRSLPTTGARVLTQLSRNTRVQVLARSPRSNWFYVQLADGTRGWVAQSFLRMNVTVRSLPVLS